MSLLKRASDGICGQARFIDSSLRRKATIHACILTCRSSQQNGGDSAHAWNNDCCTRTSSGCVLCCIIAVDIVALSERAAPRTCRMGIDFIRILLPWTSCLLSSDVSGMTSMLQTWRAVFRRLLARPHSVGITTKSLQSEPHAIRISGTSDIAPLGSMQEVYMCLACIVREAQRLVEICRSAAHELSMQDLSTTRSTESDFGPSTAW